jgi:hypothetical protein
MTISADTAVALDALADDIWHNQTSPSAALDAKLAALITEPMKVIDGRTLATGFRYSLNITNALQLRAKHWYLSGSEIGPTSLWPVLTGFEYHPQPGFVSAGSNSYGATLGLATCGAICRTWAEIIRRWLANNYASAVTPAA